MGTHMMVDLCRKYVVDVLQVEGRDRCFWILCYVAKKTIRRAGEDKASRAKRRDRTVGSGVEVRMDDGLGPFILV